MAKSQKINKILGRNVEQIITEAELWKKLKSGRRLRIKHGVDVTSPLLHLGHAVNYWKMREFQELGHKVVFLIGDFTTQIGDPTGKSKTRPEIPLKLIEENSKKFLKQATKILLDDPGVLEVRRNSEWYGKMSAKELLGLLRKVTHAQLIEREMFQRRIREGGHIFEHEIIYPILQSYDSVMVKSDMTIIGSDQLFNEMMGRKYQEIFGMSPQVIITTAITPGLDGKEKMSKSLENYVAILDSPKEKFGKTMTIPDSLIESYLKVYTRIPLPDITKIMLEQKPFDAKKILGCELVKMYHGEKEAGKAQQYFEKTFSKKELPRDLKIYRAKRSENFADFLVRNRLLSSKSDAKRLICGGGLDFNGVRVKNYAEEISGDGVLKIGQRRFIKISL